jgi:hypothetical protein
MRWRRFRKWAKWTCTVGAVLLVIVIAASFLLAPSLFGWAILVDVMPPVALTLIPAALLWYADRRRFAPHQCKRCGYDRRGLVGGADAKCPECGTVATSGSGRFGGG